MELKLRGIPFTRQETYPLYYRGELVGAYLADLIVDDTIILELKSVKQLTPVMEAQLLNYLRLSKVPVGYLMNCNGTRVVYRRFVLTGS